MRDGRPLSYTAEDTVVTHTPEQPLQVIVLARIVTHDGVLDCPGHAVVDQPTDGIQARLDMRSEVFRGIEVYRPAWTWPARQRRNCEHAVQVVDGDWMRRHLSTISSHRGM